MSMGGCLYGILQKHFCFSQVIVAIEKYAELVACTDHTYLELARTVYIYTVYDSICGDFPAKQYRTYTVILWLWPTLHIIHVHNAQIKLISLMQSSCLVLLSLADFLLTLPFSNPGDLY